MSRLIKFRVWDGEIMTYPKTVEIGINGWNSLTSASYQLDSGGYCTSAHIMQYTGLKDKNGIEIFEGDILKANDMIVPDIISVVEWGVCYAHSIGDDYTEMQGWVVRPQGYDVEPLFPFSNLEVIGNIYELVE